MNAGFIKAALTAVALTSAAVGTANAAGCMKGAVVGGVAGHYAGPTYGQERSGRAGRATSASEGAIARTVHAIRSPHAGKISCVITKRCSLTAS